MKTTPPPSNTKFPVKKIPLSARMWKQIMREMLHDGGDPYNWPPDVEKVCVPDETHTGAT